MVPKNLIIILGATASGKTNLAVNLAHQIGAEIISADSRQIFKGMDIGTGKDLAAYRVNGENIPYHLIDIKEAGDKYHVNAFKEDFYQSFELITTQNKLPILCGGTGMYIHSLLQNHEFTAVPVNTALREKLLQLTKKQLLQRLSEYPSKNILHADLNSVKRLVRAIEIAEYLLHNHLIVDLKPTLNPLIIGLKDDVEMRRKKILERLDQRLNNGLIEEVKSLIANGVSEEILVFYGLEYKFIVNYLNGDFDFDTLRTRLGTAICQYAKRQMTFFRKMEKDGVTIHWIEANQEQSIITSEALKLIKSQFD